MKCSIKYSKILVLASFMVLLFGCSKNKFLNVNTNPNDPVNLSVNYVLPTAEANIGYMVSNTLSIYGGLYAEYWAADPNAAQYDYFDSYIVRPTDDTRLWADLYAVGTNLNYIIADTTTAHRNYAAIAYLLKAYNFQILADAFGNIPLTQSLQGKTYLNPKYDSMLVVYDSLPLWVNKGLTIIAGSLKSGTLTYNPTSPPEDLIYPNQPMTEWQAFGNTLLLKIYLRECRKNPGAASAGITALSATSPTFLSVPSTDDAKIIYNNQLYQQYPYYETNITLGGYRSLCASSTCINYMDSLNDPRLADFYTPTPGGLFTGELQGDYNALAGTPDTTFCSMGTEVFAPTASTRFITASESYFLQAEAVARGYMSGSAATLYNDGIQASWQSWTNSNAAIANISTYESQPKVAYPTGSVQQQVMAIITQKWISMCGNQNFEAWTEWRRIGIPQSSPDFVISVAQQDNGKFPRRLIYSNDELQDNINFPGVQIISVPVWWDVNP